MLGTSSLERLEEVKKIIRSLLITGANREITLPYLSRMYKEMTEENIPFNDFNYTSLRDFLSSIPDVLHLSYKNNEIYIERVDSEKSEHITNLVKKAKKYNKAIHSKTRTMNPIEPSLIHKTILSSIASADLRNNKISCSKTEFLDEINRKVGEHTFYTIEDLSSQLHEFTHLLKHDDEFIYFKKRPDLDHSDSCSMDESIGDLIRDSTKTRLKNLIEKHPEGIWCSELPMKYQKEYKLELEYTDIGFNSILEFVAALPDIFRIETPPDAKKQMVVDARKPEKSFPTFQPSNTKTYQVFETQEEGSEPFSTTLSYTVAQALMPNNVMSFYDTAEVIKVDSLCKDDKYVDVIVTEVLHPSFFWVILRKNKNILDKLMSDLQDFYDQQDLEELKIPKILLQPGQHVACQFSEVWHRAILKKIKNDEKEVLFYDYGTTCKMKNENLYYLNKKFMNVPAQAIPCGIHNVKPKDKNKWLTQVCKKFLKRVLDKPFVAYVVSTFPQGNSMMVNLIDVSRDDCEVSIDQWLIDQKLAVRGETICKKLNPTNDHYQICNYKNSDSSGVSSTNKTATSQTTSSSDETTQNSAASKPTTLNYMSTAEKLEALKKYKARYSRATDESHNEETVSTKRFKKDD